MNSLRWIFYAIDGHGLGHLVRLLALARQVRRRTPQAEFLFLTGSEAASLLWQEGFAHVKVPSFASTQHTGLRPRSYLTLLHTLVPSVIAAYQPQVLVVDTFPGGVCDELIPLLQWPLRRIFIYREAPPAICGSPIFQSLLRSYHQILAPHTPGEEDLPAPANISLEYVGPMLLRSREESLGREAARRRLRLPHDRFLVYVGLGGGGDPEHDRTLSWILEQAPNFPHFHFACAWPPLQTTRNEAANPNANVTWLRYFPLAECWAAFDGAISAAGYNSSHELLHHGVPTIWTPQHKKMDEQGRRAERFVQKGAGWLVSPYDSAALRIALEQLADKALRGAAADQARRLVTENGAEQAADAVLRRLASIS